MTQPDRDAGGRPRRQLVRGGIVALMFALVAGPGQGQETPAPDPWTGCWHVEWGEWRPPIPQDDTLLYRPPPRVQFTDAPSGRPVEGSYHAQPAPGSLPTPHSVSDWTPVAGDSLWIQWSSGGLHGTGGWFAGRGDTLEGRLRTITDRSGAQRYRAEASLVRVSCPVPPEVPASVAGPGLWFVPLEVGDTIHLGRLLPEELIDRAGDVSYRIAGTPTGFFAGAREVRTQLTRGGAVADVRLRYPRDASLDSLVAVFRDTLGSPPHTDERPRRTRVLWLTETNSVTLRHSGQEPLVFLGYPGADWGVPPEHVQVSRDDSTGAGPRSDWPR